MNPLKKFYRTSAILSDCIRSPFSSVWRCSPNIYQKNLLKVKFEKKKAVNFTTRSLYDTIRFLSLNTEEWRTGLEWIKMNLATLNSPDLNESKYDAEESWGGGGEIQPVSLPSLEAV